MTNSKQQFYIGYYIKENLMVAEVRLVFIEHKLAWKTYKLKKLEIVFDKNYNKPELKELFQLEMPLYFSKEKKNWTFNIQDQQSLIVQLNWLISQGFVIDDVKNNTGLQKYMATLV